MSEQGKKGVRINLELNSEAIYFHSSWRLGREEKNSL
jgi:hypothetical protein